MPLGGGESRPHLGDVLPFREFLFLGMDFDEAVKVALEIMEQRRLSDD